MSQTGLCSGLGTKRGCIELSKKVMQPVILGYFVAITKVIERDYNTRFPGAIARLF